MTPQKAQTEIDATKNSLKEELEQVDFGIADDRTPKRGQDHVFADFLLDPIPLSRNNERLPDEFFAKDINVNFAMPVQPVVIAQKLSEGKGYPIYVEPDVDRAQAISFAYTGNLSGALDNLCVRLDAGWELTGGVITIYRFKSETYYLHSLAETVEYGSSVKSKSKGGGKAGEGGDAESGSEGGFDAETNYGANIWDDVVEVIRSMLSDAGKIASNPTTGSITVTDTQRVHRKVSRYIEQENERLLRQVAVEIRVLAYSANDNANHGVNLDALRTTSQEGIGLVTQFGNPMGNMGSMLFQVLDTSSIWNGSQVIVDALDQTGEMTVLTSATLTTINNVPADVIVTETQGYFSEVQTTVVPETGVEVEVTQEYAPTGAAFRVTPHILDDHSMVLGFTANLDTLLGFEDVVVGDYQLQRPNQATRTFRQRINIDSGHTLVISGYANNMSTMDKRGTVNAKLWGLGGTRDAGKEETQIVIIITPKVISSATR